MNQDKTLNLILDKLESMDNRLGSLEKGQNELRGDVSSLREGVNSLKEGQQKLRKDVNRLGEGQQKIKRDVGVIRKTVAENKEFLEHHTHQVNEPKLVKDNK